VPATIKIAVAAAAISVLAGSFAITRLLVSTPALTGAPTLAHPVWIEAQWPFSNDLWGEGKAFKCKAADCGAEIRLYLRAKLGFCNCTTGIADDEDLERMSDFDLVGGEVAPLRAGRAISAGSMQGRARAYSVRSSNSSGKSALSIAFRDRCDMAVATVVLADREPASIEAGVLEFLNSEVALHWVETRLGL
jgi:hypothetical protein